MKKLMFAAAVMAVGAAMAVESQIVGYNQSALRPGFAMTGPDFLNVGKDAIDLMSITVGGEAYAPGESGDTVYVSALNYDGSGAYCYSWMDYEGDYEPGWYDFDHDMAPLEEGQVMLDAGDALWVQGDDGFVLLYNGEVLTETQVAVPLRAGFKSVANPFPVALDLIKVTVGGEAYAPGESGDTVYVSILNYDGSGACCYSWMDYEGDYEPGWYDFDHDMVPLEEEQIVLEPGQGLWVQGDDGFDLQFPALILNK